VILCVISLLHHFLTRIGAPQTRIGLHDLGRRHQSAPTATVEFADAPAKVAFSLSLLGRPSARVDQRPIGV
jgi:hypothetical protein